MTGDELAALDARERFREIRERFSRAALHTEAQRPLIDAGVELCTELAALTNEHLQVRRENERLRAALEGFADRVETLTSLVCVDGADADESPFALADEMRAAAQDVPPAR